MYEWIIVAVILAAAASIALTFLVAWKASEEQCKEQEEELDRLEKEAMQKNIEIAILKKKLGFYQNTNQYKEKM